MLLSRARHERAHTRSCRGTARRHLPSGGRPRRLPAGALRGGHRRGRGDQARPSRERWLPPGERPSPGITLGAERRPLSAAAVGARVRAALPPAAGLGARGGLWWWIHRVWGCPLPRKSFRNGNVWVPTNTILPCCC